MTLELEYPQRRFTVAEVHRLVAAGIIDDDESYELLDGLLIKKDARGPAHDATSSLLEDALRASLPSGWHLRLRCAFTTEDSEPEPDIVVARGNIRDFAKRHPGPADIGLVVEVAQASLRKDQELKAPLYARANVACYWVVNLVDSQIEVYTQPSGPASSPGYAHCTQYGAGQKVPFALDGVALEPVSVADVLPNSVED